MDRKKTSKKPKKSSRATLSKKRLAVPTHKKEAKQPKLKRKAGLIPYSPTEELLDETFIAQAVWECLKNNDPEGVVEVIQAHLRVVNKTRAAQQINLPRSSMYNAIKGRNPTVKTLAKLVNCCS
jgi:DNA-binding phage protein